MHIQRQADSFAYRMAMPYYHNTDAEFEPGDMILPASEVPGMEGRWPYVKTYNPHFVYVTKYDTDDEVPSPPEAGANGVPLSIAAFSGVRISNGGGHGPSSTESVMRQAISITRKTQPLRPLTCGNAWASCSIFNTWENKKFQYFFETHCPTAFLKSGRKNST